MGKRLATEELTPASSSLCWRISLGGALGRHGMEWNGREEKRAGMNSSFIEIRFKAARPFRLSDSWVLNNSVVSGDWDRPGYSSLC